MKAYYFGTLDMYGYAHPRWEFQLVENFDIYLHT